MKTLLGNLKSSVAFHQWPAPKPTYDAERYAIARAVLGRSPVVMFHPNPPHQCIFVESEPDDWRDFIEQAIASGGVQSVLRTARMLH